MYTVSIYNLLYQYEFSIDECVLIFLKCVFDSTDCHIVFQLYLVENHVNDIDVDGLFVC